MAPLFTPSISYVKILKECFDFIFSALVERVFLRIGSAETDEQLQAALSRFLPPVILKLDSKEEGVRKKVN